MNYKKISRISKPSDEVMRIHFSVEIPHKNALDGAIAILFAA